MSIVMKLGVVASVLLLAACGSNAVTEGDMRPGTDPSTSSDASTGVGPGIPTLSRRLDWKANYKATEDGIRTDLARAITSAGLDEYEIPKGSALIAVETCADLVRETPLQERIDISMKRWSTDELQTPVLISVIADNACPELSYVHDEQSASEE